MELLLLPVISWGIPPRREAAVGQSLAAHIARPAVGKCLGKHCQGSQAPPSPNLVQTPCLVFVVSVEICIWQRKPESWEFCKHRVAFKGSSLCYFHGNTAVMVALFAFPQIFKHCLSDF